MLLHDCITHRSQYNKDKIALICDSCSWTYEELEIQINKCANYLLSLNISQGDRVAILTMNSPWYPVVLFATAKIGAVFMPINFRLNSREIVELLRDANVRVLFSHSRYIEAICDTDTNHMQYAIVSLNQDFRIIHPNMEDLLRSLSDVFKPQSISPQDNVFLQYTSGTTGKSKGVLTTHAGWVQSCLIQAPLKMLSTRSVLLGLLPMCYTGGTKLLLEAFFSGSTLVFSETFDPDKSIHLIRKHGVTNTYVVPTILYQLLDCEAIKSEKIMSLRYINIGGATINEERLLDAARIFNCEFTKGYGMTELAGGSITAAEPRDHIVDGAISEKISSVGIPLIDCHVRIIDDDGNDVRRGEPGELIVKTSRVMSGYSDSALTASVFDRNGFYLTGDIARQDSDGYLYIVDRKKDMIVSGGLNIYSKEVEIILENHPSVVAAYVVGIPDKHWGEAVHAFVVLNNQDKPTESSLIEWCKQSLASYKSPKNVTFLEESDIPLSWSGKVLKRQLRANFLANRYH